MKTHFVCTPEGFQSAKEYLESKGMGVDSHEDGITTVHRANELWEKENPSIDKYIAEYSEKYPMPQSHDFNFSGNYIDALLAWYKCFSEWLSNRLTKAEEDWETLFQKSVKMSKKLATLEKRIEVAPEIEIIAEIPPASVDALLLYGESSTPFTCIECDFPISKPFKVKLLIEGEEK